MVSSPHLFANPPWATVPGYLVQRCCIKIRCLWAEYLFSENTSFKILMPFIRVATPADAFSILKIYAPYIENTSYTFETEAPTIDAFKERINSYLENWPWLVCE